MGRCNIVKCYVLLLMCSQLWIVQMECHQVEPEKKHSKVEASHAASAAADHVVSAVNKRAVTHRNHNKNNNNNESINNGNNKNHNNKNHHHHQHNHHKKNHDIYNDENISNGGNGHKPERRRTHRRQHGGEEQDIALWIEEQQLQMLSALFFPQSFSQGRLYIIEGGHVLNDIRDAAHIYKILTIPSEVKYVNFTWKSGTRKYYYNFDNLQTLDDSILKAPTVSIKTKGRIPPEEKSFSVFLPCAGNASGTAMFTVGLSIENRRGLSLPGTPLRMNFKKECAHRGVYDSLDASNPSTLKTLQGPDPACNINCGENGYCNHHKICQCKAGYTGQYCQTAFCFPQCLNGGNCTAPSVCTCPDGYQGTQCEGGICEEKCLNGGKCVQKDKCECSKGYYGLHCEFSKCVIPCMNGGRCKDTNRCRCPPGLYGNHCEIGRKILRSTSCRRPCQHGVCMPNKTCKCHNGFYGRFCNGRLKKHYR